MIWANTSLLMKWGVQPQNTIQLLLRLMRSTLIYSIGIAFDHWIASCLRKNDYRHIPITHFDGPLLDYLSFWRFSIITRTYIFNILSALWICQLTWNHLFIRSYCVCIYIHICMYIDSYNKLIIITAFVYRLSHWPSQHIVKVLQTQGGWIGRLY